MAVGRDRPFPGGLQRGGEEKEEEEEWVGSVVPPYQEHVDTSGGDRQMEVRMSQTADSYSETESSDVSI